MSPTITNRSAPERNYGIDALRVVAMFMVCVIHMNLFTKAHYEVVLGKEYFYYVGIWTESVGIIGVNLYALITGYVCVSGKWRYSRYVRLWVLVAFYTVVLHVVCYALSVSGIQSHSYSLETFARAVAKLWFGSEYWYFAAYTGLVFIIPFLNQGLRAMPKEKLTLLSVVLVILLPVINYKAGSTIYGGGYNMIWLTALYIVGANIRLYPPARLRTPWLLIIAALCTLQPLAFIFIGLSSDFGYAWPVSIVYALSLFVVFSRLEIKNRVLLRIIAWAAPASFSVYLLHVHPWSWCMLWRYIPEINVALDYPCWFAVAGGLCLYLVCTCVDRIRILLFRLCRADAVSDAAAECVESIVIRMLRRFHIL